RGRQGIRDLSGLVHHSDAGQYTRPTTLSHPHRSDDPDHGGQHLMPPRTGSHDRRKHAQRS
ncbi:MAG TPA: hypothetical protein VFA63_16060, partial [Pseudonocardiaceae bacterium]|nr:hypothetical protein [Pseudonocardiaceae bacterium]